MPVSLLCLFFIRTMPILHFLPFFLAPSFHLIPGICMHQHELHQLGKLIDRVDDDGAFLLEKQTHRLFMLGFWATSGVDSPALPSPTLLVALLLLLTFWGVPSSVPLFPTSDSVMGVRKSDPSSSFPTEISIFSLISVKVFFALCTVGGQWGPWYFFIISKCNTLTSLLSRDWHG